MIMQSPDIEKISDNKRASLLSPSIIINLVSTVYSPSLPSNNTIANNCEFRDPKGVVHGHHIHHIPRHRAGAKIAQQEKELWRATCAYDLEEHRLYVCELYQWGNSYLYNRPTKYQEMKWANTVTHIPSNAAHQMGRHSTKRLDLFSGCPEVFKWL